MIAITPDSHVFGHLGPLPLSATLVYTWAVMALLAGGSWLITRRLRSGPEISRWQNLVEVLVGGIADQIRSIVRQEPEPVLPFAGTLFLFIASANLLAVVPGYQAPTGSLSTTTALAICVFVAVPAYGIARRGPRAFLRQYLRPTPLMLPFNVIGELSRTLALAVRLYGNIMSGAVLAAILLTFAPFFFPVLLQLLGLLTGIVQAYIFAVLATVYIASAAASHDAGPAAGRPDTKEPSDG
jgi:F-type H+-transporting ATPase subunit a